MKKIVVFISLLIVISLDAMNYYEITPKIHELPTLHFDPNLYQETSNAYFEMGIQSHDHENIAYQYSNQIAHKDPTGRLEYIPQELAKELLPKIAAKFVPRDNGLLKKPDMSKDPEMKVLQQAYSDYSLDTLLHYLKEDAQYLEDSIFKFPLFNAMDSLANEPNYYTKSRHLSFLMKIFSDPAVKGLFEIYKAKDFDHALSIYDLFLKDLATWHTKDNEDMRYTIRLNDLQKKRLERGAYRVLANRRDYDQKKHQQIFKKNISIGGQLSSIDYNQTLQNQSEIPSQISIGGQLPPIDYNVRDQNQTTKTVTTYGGQLPSINYSNFTSEQTKHFSYINEMQAFDNTVKHAVENKQLEAFATMQALNGLEQLGIKDPTSYAQAATSFIEEMEKKGILEKHIDTQYEILESGLTSFFYHLKPENPLKDPKGFLRDTCNIAAWTAFHSFAPGLCVTAVEAAMIGEQVYNICAQDYSGLKSKQQAELFGKTMAGAVKGFIAQKAFDKAAPKIGKFAKNQMSSGVTNVVNKFKKNTLNPSSVTHTETVTPDGAKLTFKEKQQKFEELHLQENANNQNIKSNNLPIASLKGVVRESSSAVEHNFKYHPRIRARGVEDPMAHNFPYTFDDVILKTKAIVQDDGSLLYRHEGTLNGKDGFFEIAINQQTKTIFHRTFVGKKK